jgi:hypothetical protein
MVPTTRSTGDLISAPRFSEAQNAGERRSPQRDLDLVVGEVELLRDTADLGRVGLGGHELAPQLRHDELGRRRPREQDVEHRVAVEVAGLAEDGLRALVVQRRPPPEVAESSRSTSR